MIERRRRFFGGGFFVAFERVELGCCVRFNWVLAALVRRLNVEQAANGKLKHANSV